MLDDNRIKTLMLASQLEAGLADLYLRFAELHPELNKELWLILIQEEHGHAEAIRQLYQLTYQGKCRFDEGSIKTDAIQAIIDYVQETIVATRCGPFSVMRCVSITHDLEKSLIEKDIFSHFKIVDEYAEVLRVLHNGTLKHIQLAKNTLDKLKTGNSATS